MIKPWIYDDKDGEIGWFELPLQFKNWIRDSYGDLRRVTRNRLEQVFVFDGMVYGGQECQISIWQDMEGKITRQRLESRGGVGKYWDILLSRDMPTTEGHFGERIPSFRQEWIERP